MRQRRETKKHERRWEERSDCSQEKTIGDVEVFEVEWTQETRQRERRIVAVENLQGNAVVVDDGPTTLATATPTLRKIERVVGKEEQNTLSDGDRGGLGERTNRDHTAGTEGWSGMDDTKVR